MINVGILNLQYDGLGFANYLNKYENITVNVFDSNSDILSIVANNTYLSEEERLFGRKAILVSKTILELIKNTDIIFIMTDVFFDSVNSTSSVLYIDSELAKYIPEKDEKKKVVVYCSTNPETYGQIEEQKPYETVCFPFVYSENVAQFQYYLGSSSLTAVDAVKGLLKDLSFCPGEYTYKNVQSQCYYEKYSEAMISLMRFHLNDVASKMDLNKNLYNPVTLPNFHLPLSEMQARINDMGVQIGCVHSSIYALFMEQQQREFTRSYNGIKTYLVASVCSRYKREKVSLELLSIALSRTHHLNVKTSDPEVKKKLEKIAQLMGKVNLVE